MHKAWWPLVSQARWFSGKGLAAELTALTPLPWYCEPGEQPGVRSEIATVTYADGREEFYHLLVGYVRETAGALMVLDDPDHGRLGVVDATGHPDAMRALLTALRGGHPAMRWFDAAAVDPGERTSVWAGEQSNTTVCVGSAVLFKVFRKVEAGVNLDVEVLEALNGSGTTPALYGVLDGTLPDGGTADLGMAVQRMAGVTDGWQWACRACAENRTIAAEARQLGVRLAEVHARLAEAFGTSSASGDEIADRMRQRLDEAIAQAHELAAYRSSLRLSLSAVEGRRLPTQRVHGDFHLGQVLRSSDDWTIIDFEGEPLKPLAERRLPDSVWRDVAGMLRSFDYVRGSHDAPTSQAARAWAGEAQRSFLEGYAGGRDIDTAALAAYQVDKAIYEVVYEIRNRPNWAHIPLEAVHDEARRVALHPPGHDKGEN